MARDKRRKDRRERRVADQPPPDKRPLSQPFRSNNQGLRTANALMARNGYCYLRLFNRQYRYWASKNFGPFPNARTIMRNLQLQRTKETTQSITAEDVQRMIDEGIKKNPLKTMFPDQPKTPPNTGATSMKTAPEIQTKGWNRNFSLLSARSNDQF